MTRIKQKNLIYQGKKVYVYACDMDFGDEKKHQYELIEFDSITGVSVLPITNKGVLLIRHYHLGVDQELWGLPTGGLEPGEDPKVRAGLELQEETGYKAGKLSLLMRSHPLPGYIGSVPGYIYVGTELTVGKLSGDEPFKIQVEDFTWREVLKLIKNNTIIDSRTIASILYYRQFFIKTD